MEPKRTDRAELEKRINHEKDEERREEALRESNPVIPSSTLIGQIPQQEREEEIIREDTQRD